MKPSLPEAERHDENVTAWAAYQACEFPSLPTGRHVTTKRQL
jgi:hypothetical protein